MKDTNQYLKSLIDHHLFHILVVFVLTTIVGGWLTAEFQKRNWEYKQEQILLEKEKEEAKIVFEHISSIMDRRLYSYRQIYYALHPDSNRERLSEKFNDYSLVLYDWNERLNTNLARIELNFGKKLRMQFENEILTDFIELGILLNDAKYDFPKVENREELKKKIDELNSKVYEFDVLMLKAIQI